MAVLPSDHVAPDGRGDRLTFPSSPRLCLKAIDALFVTVPDRPIRNRLWSNQKEDSMSAPHHTASTPEGPQSGQGGSK
jgi:hypothetical protein